jgi:hypothetical protein
MRDTGVCHTQVAVYPERGVPTWEAGLLVGGNAEAHHFTVQLSNSGNVVTVPRIDVCFDAEDPFQFVRRRVRTTSVITLVEHCRRQAVVLSQQPPSLSPESSAPHAHPKG